MKKKTTLLELTKIEPNEEQVEILFEFLKNRTYSISHNQNPTFEEHREFVFNNPYRCWFLASNAAKVIGSIYVQYDNSIGLDIEGNNILYLPDCLKLLKARLLPLPAQPSKRRGGYFINVSPKNREVCKALEDLGSEIFQYSYHKIF